MACSALDARWMREVDASRGVLLTAQGLLMYFEYDEVRRLIAACAEWFPGGELLFDAVPCWLSVRSRSGKLNSAGSYRPPPWHWGLNSHTARDLAAAHPRITELRELRLPPRPRSRARPPGAAHEHRRACCAAACRSRSCSRGFG